MPRKITEEESLQVAEASRQTDWKNPSFMKELFMGNFRLDLIHPFPLKQPRRPEFQEFLNQFTKVITEKADPNEIDETGEYPPELIQGLREIGAFGMKIPKEYGGLGFTQAEYQEVMQILGSYDGNISALLSAHQSIGVPQPLKIFGSPELKKEYLPRCARGEISAFALTEPGVGSDPARMATTYVEDGDHYVINGEKLWCTNGTIADLLVVMAVSPKTKKISAFVVEADWEGVRVDHRCYFMGLKALANAAMTFTNVRVPKMNLIGEEGRGLKIALTTLNDGRLSIPNGVVGAAKSALQVCREWSREREQWGKPVGKHEAISHKLADMAATTFAMEAIVRLTTAMADAGNFDIRLEAAASKEWNTVEGWKIVDDAMQIRSGRGYETYKSLEARGEKPTAIERMMRDFRINLIFEGSSEIMHLFMAREAVDKHLQVSGDLIDPSKSNQEKIQALVESAAFYGSWYPTRWLGWGQWPRFEEFGPLARHLRFVERKARKLARETFHGMVVHQARLQNKQAFLFRLVDVANELFSMAASVCRAHAMKQAGHKHARSARQLADLHCRNSTRKINRLFQDLWRNDDSLKYRSGLGVLRGDHQWMEEILAMTAKVGDSKAKKAAPTPKPKRKQAKSSATPAN